MPTYDYECAQCGGFEALRPLRLRDEPAACPGCGTAAARVLA
ncbi:zinc ribbon domain-containing protein, partial [Delftia tsuruhatensis]